jgi:endonuclease
MPLYEKPVRLLMKDMADELAASPDAIFKKNDAIAWFRRRYPKIKTGTVSAHLIKLSTNARSRTHYNAKPGDDDVLYQIDGSHFRRYHPTRDPAPIYAGRPAPDQSNIPEGEDEEEATESTPANGEFAYETDLRNYLVKNLSALEAGLRLYEEEGISGVEFPVGGRFIDVLAIDQQGGLVVIELKVSRGYDRVVGQLMRYIAWVKKNLAEPEQSVRGIIVARQISEDLLLACSMVPSVELFEYELSLSLRRVDEERA